MTHTHTHTHNPLEAVVTLTEDIHGKKTADPGVTGSNVPLYFSSDKIVGELNPQDRKSVV